jgi:hypothetical protein
VVAKASTGSPAPAAVSTAVVSHTCAAAVISSPTRSRSTRIGPPPMNAISDRVWGATLGGSSTTLSARSSVKPYLDTGMNNVAPNPISAWVRNPALLCRGSRVAR